MTFSRHTIFFFVTLGLLICGCKEEEIKPVDDPTTSTNGVVLSESHFPFQKLSDYQFFTGVLSEQTPNEGVYPYKTASKLFTDYAKKKRFVYIPDGEQMNYVADDELLDMPVGTALIKTFYYDQMLPQNESKILETRVMLKTQSGWEFAEYVWNEDQDEAVLEMDGMDIPISWDQEGTNMNTDYRIPSETECMICHKFQDDPIPIGLKPQNIDHDLDFGGGPVNQLQHFISEGILSDNVPGNINAVVDYSDVNQPLEERVRSYLDINCAHCHREGSHCSYRPLRLSYSETDIPSNMGVCVEPDEFLNSALTYIITPSNTERSVMHYRLSSTDQNEMMPLLGRSVVHNEGLQLIEDYINSLTGTCE
tara:strand:+ start:59762 stop:60856 length:1095 start_codon:yes stop_codon:yes gene_type:complete